MESREAIEILRGFRNVDGEDARAAMEAGAEALELLAWQLEKEATIRLVPKTKSLWMCFAKDEGDLLGRGDSPLTALRNARKAKP